MSLEFHEHNLEELKRDKDFFRKVIQKHRLFQSTLPKPMFNANLEECAKYVFTGICICNGKCAC